jgi:acetyl-CoA C-acetyltransferase
MTAYIVDAIRTPRGRGNDKGALRDVKPVHLLGQMFSAMADRTGLDTALVTDAVSGCVTQTGDQGANVGKAAAMAAGWSDSVSAVTINRYCASGLSALSFAALQAQAQDCLAVGGGVEMMSRIPMAADKGALTHDFDFIRATKLLPIGLAADVVATMEGFDRAACDAYAAASQARAGAAREAGHFKSLVPVRGADGAVLLERDETPRPATTQESLAGLQPAFAEMGARYGFDAVAQKAYGLPAVDHVHTAGNSPATADGASLVLVGSAAAVQRAGLQPRGRIVAVADAAIDRIIALTGAVDATKKVLAKAGLTPADIDLYEVNESFAALMLHYARHMNIGMDRLNVNGGAVALGHAMGSTGTALVGTMLDELERRDLKRGCIAICGAAGVAVAMVVERV